MEAVEARTDRLVVGGETISWQRREARRSLGKVDSAIGNGVNRGE